MADSSCNDYENDDFYEEIRRQIMLLTAEQGDNDDDESHSNEKLIQPCGGRVLRQVVAPAGRYFSWCEGSDDLSSCPDWLVNLWRRSSNVKNCCSSGSSSNVGTGVFIPQIVKCRGRNRPRRRRNEGNKMQVVHSPCV
ncbi:hypothetical protein LINPERPRIM_LOCUS23105 [Linum perenne]